jgi:hypothetical protein
MKKKTEKQEKKFAKQFLKMQRQTFNFFLSHSKTMPDNRLKMLA